MRGSPTCFRSRSTAVFYRSKLSFDSKAQYLIGFCGPHSLARSVAWKKLPGTSRKRRRAAFPPPVFIGWSTIVAGTRAFIQNNRYRAAVTGRWGRPPPQKFATGRCLYKLLLLLYGLRKRSLFFFSFNTKSDTNRTRLVRRHVFPHTCGISLSFFLFFGTFWTTIHSVRGLRGVVSSSHHIADNRYRHSNNHQKL